MVSGVKSIGSMTFPLEPPLFAIIASFNSFTVAKLQILFELWRVLTGNVADTAKIISIRTFGDVG